eukprot:403361026
MNQFKNGAKYQELMSSIASSGTLGQQTFMKSLIENSNYSSQGAQDMVIGKREAFQELQNFQKDYQITDKIQESDDENDKSMQSERSNVINQSEIDRQDNGDEFIQPNQIVLELNEEQKAQIEQAALQDGENLEEQLRERAFEFDSEMVEFNQKFEEQINTHICGNAFTDRKYIGSFVGMSVFGGVGFLVFSSTYTFGIAGGVLGIVLGGVVGSRIRRKIDLKKLSIYQFLAFKITQIIKWTNKNLKKLDQLWYTILMEKKTLKLVRKFLTTKRSLSMLEPHIPTIQEFQGYDDVQQKKTIYKAFNFYIPFLHLLKLSKSFSQYKNLKIYKKLIAITYSPDLISSMIRIVDEMQSDQRVPQYSLDNESVIYLPDENEILEIIQNAVNSRNYEPFALLEKRVIQCICIEKLVQEQRQEELERNQRLTQEMLNSNAQKHNMSMMNQSIEDQIHHNQLNGSQIHTQKQYLMLQPGEDKYPNLNINMIKQEPKAATVSIPQQLSTFRKIYNGPHNIFNKGHKDRQMSVAKGDNDTNMSFDQDSHRQSYIQHLNSPQQVCSEQQNNKYQIEKDEEQIQIQVQEEIIQEEEEIDPVLKCDDQDFIELLKVAAEDISKWDKCCSGDNVAVYKKMTEGSPVVLLKASALIKGITPETVYEVMSNQELRKQWDKVLSNFEIIEDDPVTGKSVLYYMIKTPIGVSNRDFLQQRKVKFDFPAKNMISMHFRSVTHPKCPPIPKNIRADTIISGYVFEKIFNFDGTIDTQLTIISQNDIKGIVPKAIVNMAASKAPKQWVQNLVKGCQDYVKTHKQ